MLFDGMHDNYIFRICHHQYILPSLTDQPVLLGNFMFLPTNASLHIYAAHVKASMMGSSLTIPITSGSFNLGIWQVLSFPFFCNLKAFYLMVACNIQSKSYTYMSTDATVPRFPERLQRNIKLHCVVKHLLCIVLS